MISQRRGDGDGPQRLGVLLETLRSVLAATDELDRNAALVGGLEMLGLSVLVGRVDASGEALTLVDSGPPDSGPPEAREFGHGVVRSVRIPLQRRGPGLAAISEALTRLSGVYVADARPMLRELALTTATRGGDGAASVRAICAPALVHRRLWGLLLILGEELTEDEVASWTVFSSVLAQAYEQAEIQRDLRSALLREHGVARELRRLDVMVSDLAVEERLDALLRGAVAEMAAALRVDRAFVTLVDSESGAVSVAATVGVDDDLERALAAAAAEQPSRTSALGRVGREAVVANDVRFDPDWAGLRDAFDRAGVRSAVVYPLPGVEGGQGGALTALREESGRPSAESLELGQRYARYIAAYVAMYRRREQSLERVRSEVLEQFARAIPHELGQPVSVVVGYAELIAGGRLEGEALRSACVDIGRAGVELAERLRRLEQVSVYRTREFGPGRIILDVERSAQ